MTHFVFSEERGLSVTAILITLPHGQPHTKMAKIIFYAISPHRKYTRQTRENLSRRGVHAIYCCKQAKQPVILSSSTPQTQLSQVRSEAWVEKIKSLSVSLNFPKESNCFVFSNFIPLFPRFLFSLGARTFSVPIGHLFPIFGAERERYLSCNSCVPTQRCTFTMPCVCGQN